MAAFAATYYVDYAEGSDSASGSSEDSAWQHCPGDAEAVKKPASCALKPGDVVKFKGGVVYRGQINITASGSEGSPIVYDGNFSSDWGTGKAIIDGAVPLENLRKCQSAAEAFGNPNFEKIYWTAVPSGAQWNTLNVRQGDRPLAVAQDPNPADPIFQENPKYYVPTGQDIPHNMAKFRIKTMNGMTEDASRPVLNLFSDSKSGGVIRQMAGGAIQVSMEEPQTVTALSIRQQSNLYTSPKTVRFTADGNEVLVARLADVVAKPVEERFPLKSPITFTNLVITFVDTYPQVGKTANDTPTWGVVNKIGAYDSTGNNVLSAEPKGVFENKTYFTQKDPAFFDASFFALYAKPNFVYYKRILGYDPAASRITFEPLTGKEVPYEKGGIGAFAIVNCVQHIDQPGEYALLLTPEKDGSQKIFVWPNDNNPEQLVRAQYGKGFALSKASFITLQGFQIRGQGGAGSEGVACAGPASDLAIRGVEVSGLRGSGSGINAAAINNVLIENCTVQNNGGHTKGILIRNAWDVVIRGCHLRKNSSTALDFYSVTNGVVQDCLVTENAGMHANGLTFYVGCENILVERNIVREGYVALTVQMGRNMIIRNNILEGGHESGAPAIGLWDGKPFNNVLIINNLLRFHGGADDWAAAVFGGNPSGKGYVIINNILDGFGGNTSKTAFFHNNLFTRYGAGLTELQLGNNRIETDLNKIFIAPDRGDYRLKDGSPAIGAGVAVQSLNQYDILGAPRGNSEKVDIGPYAYTAGAPSINKPVAADPATFRFSLNGFTFEDKIPAAPVEAAYKTRFKEKSGAQPVTVKGMDFSAQGEGQVRTKPESGHVFGWDATGHWLEWSIDAPEAGLYEIVVEHSSQAPSARTVTLNSAPVAGLGEVSFLSTGAWATFTKTGLSKPVTLKKGKNTLRLINARGPLNLKSITALPIVSE
jgi:hypothetical protein